MKRKVSVFFLVLIVLSLTLIQVSYAYTIDGDNLIEEYEIIASDEEAFTASVKETITTESGTMYKLVSLTKEEAEDNTIEVEVTETQNSLTTSNEATIRSMFGEEYSYSQDGYSGTLTISDVSVQSVSQGTYEQIESLDIDFTYYTVNDLYNISKTYESGGYTWYLIDVDWVVQESETIGGQEVATYYQGTMHYQTIKEYENPYLYNATVTYSGEVTKDNPTYYYTAVYEEEVIELVVEEPEVVVEEPEETNYVPAIIISTIGLVLVIAIVLLLNKNTKIYNKDEKGNYNLIKRVNLGTNNLYINLTNVEYKTNSNLYMIKLSNHAFNKVKGKTIEIANGKKKTYIKINNQYSEFTL